MAAACAALLWATLAWVQPGSVRELTILHFNDLHARLMPARDGAGGFAHVATLLKRERAAAPASITLNAGDLVQGTPVSTMFDGVPIFELANLLGIDVNTLGNHEFDYGWRTIRSYLDASTFDTVNANVVNDAGQRLLDKPYVVRNVAGVRIAVVGAVLEKIPVRRAQLDPWHVAPVVETLRPVVAEAKQRADLVIVLAHITLREAEAVLRTLSDAAIVVAGHDHDGIEKELEQDGRILVNAGGYGRDIGRLRIRYDTAAHSIVWHEWTRLPVDSRAIPADAEVQRAVDGWEAKVSKVVDVPIGRSTKPIDRDEGRMLMQRAVLDRFGVDAAFIERGSVRDEIPEGALLARHIWNMSPFQDHVATLTVSGRELAELTPEETPMLLASGTTIDSNRRYRVAASMFTAMGWIEDGRPFELRDEGVVVRDVVIEWIKKRQVVP